MNSTVTQLLTDLALIAVLSLVIWFVQNKMKKLLTAMVNSFINFAEEKIQGSKMGAVRKAWVIARLEESGIKVNSAISKLIDALVTIMNAKKAAAEAEATTNATEAVSGVIDAVTTATATEAKNE